jgi:hypothetical protein
MSIAFFELWSTLMDELIKGSPNPAARTYILNRGDTGLLASLDQLPATAASAMHGGPSIAAHVDHLRYGLAVINGWARNEPLPFADMDWTASWRKNVVSDDEWRTLRHELRREATTWIEVLRTPREVSDVEAGWMAGTIAHVAYHFGAIRQIDRATRGPTAEDEARAEAAL